jgi:hypothetical protein
LELIKIAIVQQNDTLYQAGIADTQKWLIKNFSKEKRDGAFFRCFNKTCRGRKFARKCLYVQLVIKDAARYYETSD